MTILLIWVVQVYRFFISPLLRPSCRFFPSCSDYAEQVLQQHGWLRGGWLSLRRLLRCHPFNAGGWDPPPVNASSACTNSSCDKAHRPKSNCG